MQTVSTIADLRQQVAAARSRGCRVALVPTMGALHAGHVSLIRAARAEADCVVTSIFVNPTQFGPTEDFDRYPRDLAGDCRICAEEGVEVVFAPSVSEVYPAGFATRIEVPALQRGLCGRLRPGHFAGVATVVVKLFNMVQPDVAYFGQKDAQQARIIIQLVRDLDLPIRIRVCPIVRESDGLALSSRNQYLSAEERPHATALYRALSLARERIQQGEREAKPIRDAMLQLLHQTPGADVDYVEIVDWEKLEPVETLEAVVLIALAVRFGQTRLIDNTVARFSDGVEFDTWDS